MLHLRLSILGAPSTWVAVSDWADASAQVRAFIDGKGIGSSQWTGGEIREASPKGPVVAHVSYNGRVWAGTRRAWKAGDAPLFPVPGTV